MSNQLTYTVTLSGIEREDGEKPYDYIVHATGLADAVRQAVEAHSDGLDANDMAVVWVESVRPGLVVNGHYNDLRR